MIGVTRTGAPVLHINAVWDDEAKVWTATSEDLPGPATEAATQEGLLRKLRMMVPELLELNGLDPDSGLAPQELLIHSEQRASLAC
tara:strand:- start:89082 stop:89339 length:258 start_codon:yes stop_codon:yes gene_type:complete